MKVKLSFYRHEQYFERFKLICRSNNGWAVAIGMLTVEVDAIALVIVMVVVVTVTAVGCKTLLSCSRQPT